jgi:hypothetical protein
MEKIAEFNDNNGFNVTLTSDKIYITAIGQEETFALRSVSGVGLYDDIKKYNQELKDFELKANNRKNLAYVLIVLGILHIIVYAFYLNFVTLGLVAGGIFIAVGIFQMNKNESAKKPVLDSFFNLMLSGGDRKFPFNKSGKNAKQIALFVNKVEDTLTAYNKA